MSNPVFLQYRYGETGLATNAGSRCVSTGDVVSAASHAQILWKISTVCICVDRVVVEAVSANLLRTKSGTRMHRAHAWLRSVPNIYRREYPASAIHDERVHLHPQHVLGVHTF